MANYIDVTNLTNGTTADADDVKQPLTDLDGKLHEVEQTLAALQQQVNALEAIQDEARKSLIGSVRWWPTDANLPAGWVILNGTTYTRTDYPTLL